jgi:ADP-ribosylglycohydrolase
MTTLDKIKGMIFGAMYGDAFGAPHEFRKDKIMIDDLTMKSLNRFSRYAGKYIQTVAGQYTDDTEMAFVLLSHIINKNNYNEQEMIMEYMKWANSKIKFIGKNTRELFKGIKTLNGYNKRFSKKYSTQEQKNTSLSNGALMRCYPFVIYGLKHDDYLEVAMKDCALTNPSKLAMKVEKKYITSLMKALKDKSKKSIVGNYVMTDTHDVTINKG